MFVTVLAAISFLEIEKVAVAEVSVTWTDKVTALPEELSTCICFIKHRAFEGDVKTEVVSVVVKFMPALERYRW